MGDTANSDTENAENSPLKDVQDDSDRRPFGDLEFQVSAVVERLEAGVNSQERNIERRKPEPPKISKSICKAEAMPLGDILNLLADMVVSNDFNGDSCEPAILPLDIVGRAAILSHSLAALLNRLQTGHAARIGAHIASETTLWLSHMIRFSNYHAHYHQDRQEGLVKVVRMLLHHRYPRYLEDGALAFSNRLPCIYSSMASPLGIVQHLCRQLGLPLACVRPVSVHSTGKIMDWEALDRMCEEDLESGRPPLLLLVEAGAPPTGTGESLSALAQVCAHRKIYMHLSGHALALPAVLPNNTTPHTVANSFTIMPGKWFGAASLPNVTLYRMPEAITANENSKSVNNNTSSREGTLAALAGFTCGSTLVPALPLWCAIRAAGSKHLVDRLVTAFTSARAVYRLLSTTEGIKLKSRRPGGDEPPAVDLLVAMGNASCCVAWQYAPEEFERPPPYYDKLNSWLGQVLQREADMINIQVCETEAYGVILRYCPLEGATLNENRIQEFAAILDSQLQVLHATVALREPFQNKVNEHQSLQLIHVPGWAGLGGVRYVPPGWEGASEDQLNSLNRQLVDTLRATDGAFSCGENEEGLVCIRFGMVTEDTDVEELLDLVTSAGKEVEESSRVLTTMSEVLKKGIEEATADLERENAERLWQEGLLRRVPVVGRVVGWWAPPPPAPPGRRLHLHNGTLQPTDDMYRSVLKKEEDTEPARAHSPARPPQ